MGRQGGRAAGGAQGGGAGPPFVARVLPFPSLLLLLQVHDTSILFASPSLIAQGTFLNPGEKVPPTLPRPRSLPLAYFCLCLCNFSLVAKLGVARKLGRVR